MKLFIALLLSALSLYAQCPTDLEVPNLTASWIQMKAVTPTVGTNTRWKFKYGTTTSLTYTNTEHTSGHASIDTRWINITNVGPSQKIYFDFLLSDNSAVYNDSYLTCAGTVSVPGATCPNGVGQQTSLDSYGNVYCEDIGAGQLMNYVTMASTKSAISSPTSPTLTRTYAQAVAKPTITGSTTNVTVTAGACTNLQAILNDHGTSGTKDLNLNHKIVIPSGVTCLAEDETSGALSRYNLPAKTGTGTVLITCGWDSEYSVPEGSAFTPDFRNANECGIALNTDFIDNSSPFAQGQGMIDTPCLTVGCTQGWYFDNLVFYTDNWRDQTLRTSAVTSVDNGAYTITPTTTTGKFGNYIVTTFSLPGMTTLASCNGTYNDFFNRGNSQLLLSGGNLSFNIQLCPTSWLGTYAGGGWASTGPHTFEITSCVQNGSDVDCTLEMDHHQGSFVAHTISDLTSGVVTTVANHGITTYGEAEISGNSACDGIYNVTTYGASTVTLNTACSGTGGTIKRVYTGLFFEATGTASSTLNGVHNIEYPSANVVRIRNLSLAGGTITGGGYAATAGGFVSTVLNLTYPTRTTVARCYFSGHKAIRLTAAVSVAGVTGSDVKDIAVIDNWFEKISFWLPEGPLSGSVDGAQSYRTSSSISRILGGNVYSDVRFEGNTIRESPSFAIFADGPFNDGVPNNVEIKRNHFLYTDKIKQGDASLAIPRIAYNWRGHFIELKGADKVLIDGLYGQNNVGVGTSNSNAIYLSYWTSTTNTGRVMNDVTIKNVRFKNITQPFGIITQGGSKIQEWKPIQRILIDNVLVENTPWPDQQGDPYTDLLASGSFYTAGYNAGGFVWLSGPFEDIRITNATLRRPQYGGSQWTGGLVMSGPPGNGFQVDNSVLAYSGDSANGFFTYDFNYCCLPSVTANGEAGFLGYLNRMGSADPLSWLGASGSEIGVIPCISEPAAYTASADFTASNSNYTEATTGWACTTCTNWNILFTGADSQSCATRESNVLNADFTSKGTFAGLGYSKTLLDAALGNGVTVDVSSLTTTSGTIGYTVPSGTGACTVDYTTSSTFASGITRAVDSGVGTSRSASVSGSAGQTIYYRVLCPQKNEITGSLQLGS